MGWAILSMVLIFIGTCGAYCALRPANPDWPAWTK
jgi:hypothetical protein